MLLQSLSTKTLSTQRPPVHADPEIVGLENAREFIRGELGFLIGVEYLWLTLPECLFRYLNTQKPISRVIDSLHASTYRL
jgi:phosphatidylglycerophosphatase A